MKVKTEGLSPGDTVEYAVQLNVERGLSEAEVGREYIGA